MRKENGDDRGAFMRCLAGGLAGIGVLCLAVLGAAAAADRAGLVQAHPCGTARICLAAASACAAGIGCRARTENRLPKALLSLLPIAMGLAFFSWIVSEKIDPWSFLTDLLIAGCGAFLAAICTPRHKRRRR